MIRVVVNGVVREYFFVLGEPPATETQMNGFGSGAIPLSLIDFDPPPICFGEGTEVDTPLGRRPMQDLRPGDAVLTEDGRTVCLAWVEKSTYPRKRAAQDDRLRPVHLRAGAFGPGLPESDLVLSPQHRVVVEGPACELLFGLERAFVIARHLPEPFATRPEPEADVTYYHLFLENHEVLVTNGLPSESLQPARRMIEAMSDEARESLMAVLEVLGTDAMLTRPDALPTLNHRETRVLLAALAPAPDAKRNTFARAVSLY